MNNREFPKLRYLNMNMPIRDIVKARMIMPLNSNIANSNKAPSYVYSRISLTSTMSFNKVNATTRTMKSSTRTSFRKYFKW